MPTSTVKTIGSTGDYSTIQAWEAACPADLVANDEIWQGQLQNENFDLTGSTVTIAGVTTDATRYIELTTVAGASFADNGSVQSNALRYNTSNGASISNGSNYIQCVDVEVAYTRISKIQMATTAGASVALVVGVRALIQRCIFESATSFVGAVSAGSSSGSADFANCLFVQRGSGATKIAGVFGNFNAYNCTFAVPSDKTAATYGLDGSYATVTLQNCAVFGATNTIETANSTFTSTTCRTDAASPPTGFTQISYDTSTGSGFQNITDATRDYRIKSGSAMLDVGTTDATNAAIDIAGTSRPQGTFYDIGCWELVAAGGDTLMGQACL